jgi:hypothetical protein
MSRLSRAFDRMMKLIDGGKEFPCAHANAVGFFALTDKEAIALIELYDKSSAQKKGEN